MEHVQGPSTCFISVDVQRQPSTDLDQQYAQSPNVGHAVFDKMSRTRTILSSKFLRRHAAQAASNGNFVVAVSSV